MRGHVECMLVLAASASGLYAGAPAGLQRQLACTGMGWRGLVHHAPTHPYKRSPPRPRAAAGRVQMAASPEVQTAFILVSLLSVGHGLLPQWPANKAKPSATRNAMPPPRRPSVNRRASKPQMSAADIFESEGWPALKLALDRLPVFTVANDEGNPMEYEVGGKQVALFYSDIGAAQTELSNARLVKDATGCDLIPVGLGEVWRLAREGQALLVPGRGDLKAAGAPPNAQPVGQALPLFACMEMSREGESGAPVLPLFMSHADCEAAVVQATAADEPDAELEIVTLALDGVVDRLAAASADEELAFTFIPPSDSVQFIEDFLAGPSTP